MYVTLYAAYGSCVKMPLSDIDIELSSLPLGSFTSDLYENFTMIDNSMGGFQQYLGLSPKQETFEISVRQEGNIGLFRNDFRSLSIGESIQVSDIREMPPLNCHQLTSASAKAALIKYALTFEYMIKDIKGGRVSLQSYLLDVYSQNFLQSCINELVDDCAREFDVSRVYYDYNGAIKFKYFTILQPLMDKLFAHYNQLLLFYKHMPNEDIFKRMAEVKDYVLCLLVALFKRMNQTSQKSKDGLESLVLESFYRKELIAGGCSPEPS